VTTSPLLDHRVRAGIALLDESGPTNWRARVDVDKLDLENPRSCVLGQVYGTFDDGMAALDLSFFEGARYGFVTGLGLRYDRDSWRNLTDAWRDAFTSVPPRRRRWFWPFARRA